MFSFLLHALVNSFPALMNSVLNYCFLSLSSDYTNFTVYTESHIWLSINHLQYLTKCFLIVYINLSISHAIQFILYFLSCNSIRFRRSYKNALSHPIFWKSTESLENGIGVHSIWCFLNALYVSANPILKQMYWVF